MLIDPRGYRQFHNDDGLNYMLNRLAWVIPVEDLHDVASRIETLEDWVREMTREALRAEADGRNAIASKYYQGAEFYMAQQTPGKLEAYEKFVELHDLAYPEIAALRASVPFGDGALPALDRPAEGQERGVILAHSGYDGLVEEMYPTLEPLAKAGYRVIAFEGPGQGGALRRHHLKMTRDWHRPVGAVLDHFGLSECTLVGVSLGGCLAPRAAAKEPRVKRVVSWGAMYDFFDTFAQRMGHTKLEILRQLTLLGAAPIINAAVKSAAKSDQTMRWGSAHGLHVTGMNSPYEFMKWAMGINLHDVHDQIWQDVLIIMGTDDHIVPIGQLHDQSSAMTQARSVTTRLMTAEENGAQHCQVGNPFLATDEIRRWLEGLDLRNSQLPRLANADGPTDHEDSRTATLQAPAPFPPNGVLP
ncbi:alpha/beta fold hydrolase [uncultured Erythrobacter sp.]|uniref:alpha/beta hydrolase n=1 Tax=uncultured Erythrobacter sp. TaxID=263913 RepID=UPI0026133559|nr:alpha/beta fold hydrolase [uncultured Erythrobacter sp.]